MSRFYLENTGILMKFVISDPSTFLYFNKERPFTNGTNGFGIPDETWLQSSWKVFGIILMLMCNIERLIDY